jgi:hypothetical protein
LLCTFGARKGRFREPSRALGEGPVFRPSLSIFDTTPARRRVEFMENKYRVPIFVAVERLQEASQQAGLTEDDVTGLLACGLDVTDAVTYVEAVLSNRVH